MKKRKKQEHHISSTQAVVLFRLASLKPQKRKLRKSDCKILDQDIGGPHPDDVSECFAKEVAHVLMGEKGSVDAVEYASFIEEKIKSTPKDQLEALIGE